MTARSTSWRATFVALVAALTGTQLLDFWTAQQLSSIEPRGYFAEASPLLAQIADPALRQFLGLALKVALVTFVVVVAVLQRRWIVTAAVLVVGTLAGLFGA